MKYKVFPLIPRVRVNYRLSDLVRCLFVSEKHCRKKQRCEEILSEYFDSEYTLLVGSGRSAIYHILKALPQKKVLIPAYTCMVVPEAVTFAGKEISYMNTSPETFNSDVLPKIDDDTIVLATHQFGFACNIELMQKVCYESKAILIEDCAAAMGTTVDGKKVGTFGDFAIVSFNSTKLLNVPSKGGLIVAKKKENLDLIKELLNEKPSDCKFKAKHLVRGLIFCLTKNRWLYRCFHYLAIDRNNKLQRTEHEVMSTKMEDSYLYSFSEWQASVLLPQIYKMDEIILRRKQLYKVLDENIANPLLRKPKLNENEVCCRYPVLVKNRTAFYRKCLCKGVDMDFSHSALACDESYVTEHKMAEEVLDIPFYFDMSDKELGMVIKVVNSVN